MQPESAIPELMAQLQVAKALHECDLTQGHGRGLLPYALASTYPNADKMGGHADVKTTQIYTHVLNRGPHGVQSPLDR